jgi:hypothetical protein
MSKVPASAPSSARSRLVRRLSALVGWSVLLQAAAFLLIAWSYRFAAQALLDAVARSRGAPVSAAAEVGTAIFVVLLDLFLALLIGFFGARWLLRSIVRATPPPNKPPTRPIPWASLCAAALIATISILALASKAEPLASPLFSWAIELFKDGAVFWLFWYAARRVVGLRHA